MSEFSLTFIILSQKTKSVLNSEIMGKKIAYVSYNLKTDQFREKDILSKVEERCQKKDPNQDWEIINGNKIPNKEFKSKIIDRRIIEEADLVFVAKPYTIGVLSAIKRRHSVGRDVEDIYEGILKADNKELMIKYKPNISNSISKPIEMKKIDLVSKWSLFDKEGNFLKERSWDGGNQLTVVNDIIRFFNNANAYDKKNIVIFKSLMGSGKSPIVMNIAKQMGRAIIVVPNKNLQRQYLRDYFENGMYILKNNGEKLKIAMIMGRGNYECLYSRDKGMKGCDCKGKDLPCTKKLKAGELRFMVATADCKYYIPRPMLKSRIDIMARQFYINKEKGYILGPDSENDEKINVFELMKEKTRTFTKTYTSHNGETVVFFRKDGEVCPYFKQFYNYIDADILVMNSAMWRQETDWNVSGKPMCDLEILDEYDFFLNELDRPIDIDRKTIEYIRDNVNINVKKKKYNVLNKFDECYAELKSKNKFEKLGDNPKYKEFLEHLYDLCREYIRYKWDSPKYNDILFQLERILSNKDSVIIECSEKKHKKRSKDSKFKEENINIINLAIIYQEKLLDKIMYHSSNNIIMASGTMQSWDILDKLFGIRKEKYNILYIEGRKDPIAYPILPDAKKYMPIEPPKYTNWQKDEYRSEYREAFNKIIDRMKYVLDNGITYNGEVYRAPNGKILIPAIAKKYIYESKLQDRDDVYLDIREIDEKEIDFDYDSEGGGYSESNIKKGDSVLETDKRVIISTTMNRGIDLKGDECRGIIIPKFPRPDITSLYQKGIKEKFGEFYWDIVDDIANREIQQIISRGLRSEDDWCIVVSVDLEVNLEQFRRK